MGTKIVGILNVTPDSFSDGGSHFEFKMALAQAKKLIDEGADIIDIGGDSSRPGSVCVGADKEWERISRLVEEISDFCTVSVDTHFVTTAQKALGSGAKMINDISGGADPEMWKVVREFNADYVVMHSLCSKPHLFDASIDIDPIQSLQAFWRKKIQEAESYGVNPSNLFLDPGMGAFLGPDPTASSRMLEALPKFYREVPLFLGVSRKGFLKKEGERSPHERDWESAIIGARLSLQIDTLYLRVHNVKNQKVALLNRM